MSLGSFLSGLFGGSGGASRELERQATAQADQLRKDTEAKAAKLRTGMAGIDTAFSGFNDDYFNKLQQNYVDYAMPQLKDQYDEQKKNLIYTLARKSNLDSTTRGDQEALLNRQNALGTTTIEGTGADYANQARSAVQANKQDLVGQLNTTYDADAATNLALSESKALAVPKPYSPIMQLFTNISAQAAQSKLASDSNPAAYAPTGARLYSGGPSASTLVR